MSPSPPDDIAIKGPEAAGAVARLHALCFPASPWPENSCREMLEIPGTAALLHPHGFLVLRIAGGEAEILSVGVDPQERGNGLGMRLVARALAAARNGGATSVFLEVSEKNLSALFLYRKSGFSEVGRRKNYYVRQGSGEDAIIMRRAAQAQDSLPP